MMVVFWRESDGDVHHIMTDMEFDMKKGEAKSICKSLKCTDRQTDGPAMGGNMDGRRKPISFCLRLRCTVSV